MKFTKLVYSTKYGSCVSIQTNLRDLENRLNSHLPPQTQRVEDSNADEEFIVLAHGEDKYSLHHGSKLLATPFSLAVALEVLESEWHSAIALHASPFLFVHAGVVGWKGKAIIIPGRSMSGKTSLVVALLKAGAKYYSDEYAVFDESGYVHPYPKPLSVRRLSNIGNRKYDFSEFGGQIGRHPVPVALIVSTRYDEQTFWEPQRVTDGQAVLRLLENTICARTRIQYAIKLFSYVTERALAIDGNRPSGERIASSLLELCY
ncbi:MAG: hypothetical protein V8K32_11695 [Candidatus Electrothrix gigas]